MSKHNYKMETIKPLYDYVVVKVFEKEEQSAGGIIITQESEKRNIQYATVIAVGSGRKTNDAKLAPLEVKPGDTVIMAKYGGTDIGGDKFLIKEDHIWAILD